MCKRTKSGVTFSTTVCPGFTLGGEVGLSHQIVFAMFGPQHCRHLLEVGGVAALLGGGGERDRDDPLCDVDQVHLIALLHGLNHTLTPGEAIKSNPTSLNHTVYVQALCWRTSALLSLNKIRGPDCKGEGVHIKYVSILAIFVLKICFYSSLLFFSYEDHLFVLFCHKMCMILTAIQSNKREGFLSHCYKSDQISPIIKCSFVQRVAGTCGFIVKAVASNLSLQFIVSQLCSLVLLHTVSLGKVTHVI